MARTPRVVEDRRKQILDAAIRVFSQKGFSGATNKDIAREAGITPGLIYHYFASKEALLKEIFVAHSPLKLIRSLPEQSLAQPPEVFLRFVVRQALSIAESEDFVQLIRIFLPEVIHDPALSSLGVPILQEAIIFLSKYLTAQMECGVLCLADSDLAAQVLLGSLMGFVLRRQILHDALALQYTQEQIADALVDTALHGLLVH